MLKILVFLSAVACSLADVVAGDMIPQLEGRIVGGDDTTIGSFPWQVALLYRGAHFCGGTIYSSNVVITAAHCLQFVSIYTLKVRAGSTFYWFNGVLKNVAAFKQHEKYDDLYMTNDIGIIKLESPLIFNAVIKPIELSTATPTSGETAVVSGWGAIHADSKASSSQLKCVEVSIVSASDCASTKYGYGRRIKSGMICARADGKDACQGDSGGPLVRDNVLVGIVSWGYNCAHPDFPGIYTNVADFHSWVTSNAKTI